MCATGGTLMIGLKNGLERKKYNFLKMGECNLKKSTCSTVGNPND